MNDDEMKHIKELDNIKEYSLSPAHIQSICFKNKNIHDCIKEILHES
jgi:hypothetical protein